MTNKNLLAAIVCFLFFFSCLDTGKRINGNGKISTENRKIENASRIRLFGHINLILEQGQTAVRVEADENLLEYIETEQKGGWLEIKTKEHYNLKSDEGINVYITTPELKDVNVAGSGNVNGKSKFTSNDKISLELSGSGNITLPVHAPSVETDVNGSGKINLSGETRDLSVDIAGSGDFNGLELKAENAKVDIAGSGDAFVFADVSLKASVAGSGGIRYKGAASVDKDIAGSGTVEKAQ